MSWVARHCIISVFLPVSVIRNNFKIKIREKLIHAYCGIFGKDRKMLWREKITVAQQPLAITLQSVFSLYMSIYDTKWHKFAFAFFEPVVIILTSKSIHIVTLRKIFLLLVKTVTTCSTFNATCRQGLEAPVWPWGPEPAKQPSPFGKHGSGHLVNAFT